MRSVTTHRPASKGTLPTGGQRLPAPGLRREDRSGRSRSAPVHPLVGGDHGIDRAFGEGAGDVMGQAAVERQLSVGERLLSDDGRGGSDPVFAACLSLLHIILPLRGYSDRDPVSVSRLVGPWKQDRRSTSLKRGEV